MKQEAPLERLRHHVTGAIERGEKEPIVEKPPVQKFTLLAKLKMLAAGTRCDSDRELLTEACNAHEELVVALKATLECDSNPQDMGGDWGSVEWAEQVGSAIEKAREALRKAGEL